jgi:alpha-N-arabinofuranosidase
MKELKPTSTLFHRQQHSRFTFTTTMDYKPGSEKDLAGIVCLQNESSHYVFGLTKKGSEYVLVLERTERKDRRSPEVTAAVLATASVSINGPIRLKVQANGDEYSFSYAAGEGDFVNLGGTVSGDILSTNVAGGFTGSLIGLYATSANNIIPE